jgi:ribonuclease Z
MLEQIKGVDVLYHEATFTTEEKTKAIETMHSTAAQAGLIASKAAVSRLLIGHFSARYKELTLLLDEATEHFKNTSLAVEGETFQIEE